MVAKVIMNLSPFLDLKIFSRKFKLAPEPHNLGSPAHDLKQSGFNSEMVLILRWS